VTTLALAMVLVSAVLHASWNLLAKRSRGGAPFVWLFSLMTLVLYAPAVALYLLAARPAVSNVALAFAAGSAVLHVAYFVLLQRGYRSGDLSMVYPLARGTGPAVATVLAIAVLGEPVHGWALLGAALVVGAVFLLAGGGGRAEGGAALGYGLATGAVIGLYSVWDGSAVRNLAIAPLLFSYLSEAGRSVLLAPLAWRRRAEVAWAWRHARREALGVALLSPLAYILVLAAMTFTPISRVAPAREISILLGTFLGTRLLAEGQGRRRLLGALGMLLGVALLALA
jgi:drug/metabolite transporter (DMT)-like permease